MFLWLDRSLLRKSNYRRMNVVCVPLPDGRKIAARLFLPQDSLRPCPVVLSFIPYRFRDGTRTADELLFFELARRGFAGCRADVAGSGESDGLLLDEYLPQEQEDGCFLVEWLASQSWCSGRVALMGISWGGFNALQIAALRPKGWLLVSFGVLLLNVTQGLCCIVTVCSLLDRFRGDCHFTGDLLNEENTEWGLALKELSFFLFYALLVQARSLRT